MPDLAEEACVLCIETNRDGEKDDIARVEATLETATPGVDVVVAYMKDGAFKVTWPTLLQSPNAPDLFFSWSAPFGARTAKMNRSKNAHSSPVIRSRPKLISIADTSLSHDRTPV